MTDIVTTNGLTPVLYISTDTANVANANITVDCVQSITINQGQNVYNYSSFCNPASMSTVPTPATNSLSCQIIVQKEEWVSNSAAPANTAAFYGISGLSSGQKKVSFELDVDGTANGALVYRGVGYITGLSPTVGIEAPVVQSPLTIAVDKDFTVGLKGS